MNRRAFLAGVTGAVVLRPPASAAQQAKVPTVAILLAGSFPESQSRMFAQALRDLGYVEGQNIRIDIRSAENDAARLSELAAALVHEKVDVIVPFPTNAALAAKRATAEIPIVLLAVGHAVGMGIVASYARPGGNITGTTALFPELAAKHVELLKELSPNLRRIAALGNTSDAAFAKVFIDHVQRAGNAQQVDIVPVMVAAGTELDAAFPAMASNKVEAVIVQGSLVDEHVAEISIAHRLPVVSPFLGLPADGRPDDL